MAVYCYFATKYFFGIITILVPSRSLILCVSTAKHKPLRVVFRDDAFGSDSVKINVEQIFRLLSPGTEVKAI
jgi:hypothetical protein